MKVALIVSTYNKPNELWLTLLSVRQQTVMPDEIIIADDGSTLETAKCIELFNSQFGFKAQHVWHTDNGFRLATIRNKAIYHANSEYIIQIDGDLILHKSFIADHKKFAKKGVFIAGKRCNILNNCTNYLVKNKTISLPSIWSNCFAKKHNGLRISFLARILYILPQSNFGYRYVLGCNMAFWRADLLLINGYNQDFIGWGKEDNDLSIRLINAGVKLRFVKFNAIVYHLFHPENNQQLIEMNQNFYQKSILEKTTYITNGIIQNFDN